MEIKQIQHGSNKSLIQNSLTKFDEEYTLNWERYWYLFHSKEEVDGSAFDGHETVYSLLW